MRLQPLLAPRGEHLQDGRRRLLDRPSRDVDRHPLAPRIEAARVLDLALHLFHVGVFGLGFLLHRRVNEVMFYRIVYIMLFVTGVKLLSDALL